MQCRPQSVRQGGVMAKTEQKINDHKKIRILIACHKSCEALSSEILVPIRVGAALTQDDTGSMLRDDEGDNISAKNHRYCELTAQYWAWKNMDADWYGFFHYRRYLSFSDEIYPADPFNNVFYDRVKGTHISDFCLDDTSIARIAARYDMILPVPMDLSILPADRNTVYKHYQTAQFHHIEDLEFCIRYIREHYPEYSSDADAYLSSQKALFLNMYVIRKELFFAYCAWLFPILDAFDAQRDYTDDNIGELRTPGFLAERLFGVWATHTLRVQPNLLVHYAQASFIRNTERTDIEPAFAENNVAICLGADDKYTPFAGLVISSIAQNASPSKNYDIILFSNGITPANEDLLRRTLGNRPNLSLRFVDSKAYLIGDLFERDHINRSTYLRFIIPKALRLYPKAVYLDCDLVVNRDIADLFETELGDNYLAAVRDTVNPCWYKNDHDGTRENICDRLGLERPYDYFNCGVLVLNIPAFNALFPTEALFALARSRRWVWQDQDLLNSLCRGHTLLLSQKWNVLAHSHSSLTTGEEYFAPKWLYDNYLDARKDPWIIHYCGRQQPCFAPFVDLGEYFWKYARNSAMYEILLNYAAEECAGRTGTAHGTGRWRRLLHKGMQSLKISGVHATWKKVRTYFTGRISRRKPGEPGYSAADLRLLRRSRLKLLAQFGELCRAAGADWWLTNEALYTYTAAGRFFPGSASLCVGMLREDFIKLQAVTEEHADVQLLTIPGDTCVRYALAPAGCHSVQLVLYLYDRSDLSPAQAIAEHDLRRLRFVTEAAECGLKTALMSLQIDASTKNGMFAPCAAAKKTKSGSLLLGPECDLFGMAGCLPGKGLFPTASGRFDGVSVRLPADADAVLRAIYLGWKHIVPARESLRLHDAQREALRLFIKGRNL